MRMHALPAPAHGTHSAAGPSRHWPTANEAEWQSLKRWAVLYSWLSAFGFGWGVLLAHFYPVVLGRPWTTCEDGGLGCKLAFHLFDVPMVAFNVYVIYFGLRGLFRATSRRYLLLLGFANIANLAFFTFEMTVLQGSIARQAPLSEILSLSSVGVLLLGGSVMGFFVQVKLHTLFYPVGDSRYLHPTSEKELINLVTLAGQAGWQVRVRGSGHSVYAAIHTDGAVGTGELNNVNVLLDKYNKVLKWDTKRMQVTVQAGCHLGVDPQNPTSTWENSLLAQLAKRGWALPDLGGITHQTVSGFISTGSGGGTTKHDVGAAIVKLRIIDGRGQVHELSADDTDPEKKDLFAAAGVSMGLLGIISTITFQCEPDYTITGQQDTTDVDGCDIDLFAEGDDSLAKFFRNEVPGRDAEYSRLLWWPQRGLEKVQVWKARRTHPDEPFNRKPFESAPANFIVQSVVNGVFNLIGKEPPPYPDHKVKDVLGFLKLFIKDGTVPFQDHWYWGLPMDNAVDDELMPTEFTELFIDLDKSAEVMKALREFYEGDVGFERTGIYACEIYAAKQSHFWLSPAYGADKIRIDIFWFRTTHGNPDEDFYPQYWELLKRFDYRYHWGKYTAPGDSELGHAYIRQQYPMLDKFLELRRKMDPEQVFVTDYWRTRLGIEPAANKVANLPLSEQAQKARKRLRAV
jgi:D-arabinono-1,4-lactone oxidase